MNSKQKELIEQLTEEMKKIFPPFTMWVRAENGTSLDVNIVIPDDDDQAIELEEKLAIRLEDILVDTGYFFSCFPYTESEMKQSA